MYNKSTKKKVIHAIIIVIVFFAILSAIGLYILRYQVKGESNLPFNITKIIIDVTDENENAYKVLQLYLNTLYIISETDKDLEFIVAIFKLKLMNILGFTPQIAKCINCGGTNLEYFSFRDSGFKCAICGKQDTGAVHVTARNNSINKIYYDGSYKKSFFF